MSVQQNCFGHGQRGWFLFNTLLRYCYNQEKTKEKLIEQPYHITDKDNEVQKDKLLRVV